jgi:hypothetical protein
VIGLIGVACSAAVMQPVRPVPRTRALVPTHECKDVKQLWVGKVTIRGPGQHGSSFAAAVYGPSKAISSSARVRSEMPLKALDPTRPLPRVNVPVTIEAHRNLHH